MIQTLFIDAGGVLFNNINEETEFLARVADHHAVDRADLAWRAMAAARVYESGRKHVHEVFRQGFGVVA
jgi:putative hydrolase of the HAD superfamily